MIRPATVTWLALATLIVVGLFHVKHQVQTLEDEIGRVNRQIAGEREAIHVLKAEWGYINQPQRLESLSSRHLELQPLKPNQIVNLDAFSRDALDAPAVASTPPTPPPPARAIVLTPPRPRDATVNAAGGRAAVTPIVLIPPKPRDDR